MTYLIVAVLLVMQTVIVTPAHINGEKEVPAITKQEKTSYIDTAEDMNLWELTSRYERVIDDKAPIYLLGEDKYSIYCFDAARFTEEDLESWAVNEHVKLEGRGLTVRHGFTGSCMEWLSKHGFVSEEVPE